MATLGNLIIALERRLGTSQTDVFTQAKKEEALNLARREILLQYELEDFIFEATVSFTSGVGDLPSDFLRRARGEEKSLSRRVGKVAVRQGFANRDLYNATTGEDYLKVSIARFDDQRDFTWTVKQDASQVKKINIYTADTVDLTLRYVQNKADMSEDTDESGFSPQFDYAHTLWAAYYLLQDTREYQDAAPEMLRRAQVALQAAISRGMDEKGFTTPSAIDEASLLGSVDGAEQVIL